MKQAFLLLLLCYTSSATFGQYNDPNFPIPTSGYGSDGTHTVGIVSFPNAYFPGEDIKIYHPSDIATSVPTLFYSHAYGGNNPLHIIGLLNFVAKKGYAIVFVPYQTTGVSVENRYENLLAGFRKAARDYPDIIDTTRVGFMGHSFGGGATIGTAYACFTENNWGQNGRYLHPSAPWYSYNITQSELQSFPADTKLLMEVYDDDSVNDHRMAIDIFSHINISTDEKDFIVVKSTTYNGYDYTTGHDMPTTYAAFDAMDYYAYYRLIDALCDYTFNGNLAGKDVALGNGSVNQITMPAGLPSLFQSDAPLVMYPESNYGFPCSSIGNPRSSYCGILEMNESVDEDLSLFPNPTSALVTIHFPKNLQSKEVAIYNACGQLLFISPLNQQTSLDIDCSGLESGIYLIKLAEFTARLVVKN